MILGFCCIFAYLLLFVVVHNGMQLTDAVMPIYYLVDIIPFGISVRIYANKHHCGTDNFIDLLIQAGKLQAILALLAFFIPSVHTFFLDKLISYGYTDYFEYLANYRIYGFASSLTFAMPVVQTMFALILLHPGKKGKMNIPWAIILFISAVINARVSIVVALIGIVVLILFGRFSMQKKMLSIIAIAAVTIAFAMIGLPLIEQHAPWTYRWLVSGIEDVFAFLGGDNSSVYFSYATAKEQYQVPASIAGFLLGEGHITMGMKVLYGYESDVGYINDLWLGGLIYVIVLYGFYIRYMLKLFRSKNSLISFIGIMMLVSIFVVNIKGISFSKTSFNVFMFLLCIVELSGLCKEKKSQERPMKNENIGFAKPLHSKAKSE
ncbi:MAG: hypothetical protein IJY65_00625 [Clostridia bacterium]|nr:hypothetical protein [Clostridia bacterium]